MKHLTGILLSTSVLVGVGYSGIAHAQEMNQGVSDGGEEIIVTARRMEEALSDVPISISVLSQDQLNQNNVTNISDLATVTPGLQLNNRYGNDFTSFTIRGFTQEIRTYSTVGIYFADVVGPRGSGATMGGDGAGPGAMFDLQNVQVLKGPQGTLFGRNTSGGAVLLVPKKPTDRFEGFAEVSLGDDDLRRGQAVLNLPVSEGFKLRFGVDRMTREGYLRNAGTIGDGKYDGKGVGNTDYWALRASALLDITPDIENYTVGTYTDSKSNGITFKLVECTPGTVRSGIPVGDMACEQITREAPLGPWAVSNRVPDARSDSKQWQVINTTTWKVSDSLTVKNIIAYGEYRNILNHDVFGNYGVRLGTDASLITSAADVTGYAVTHVEPIAGYTNAQSSFVEELQLQGVGAGGRLTWQAGGYMELNDPLGPSGQQSYTFTACAVPDDLVCTLAQGFSIGSAGYQNSKSRFRDYALFGQASYDLTDKLTFTAGLRYTWDKQDAVIQNTALSLATQTASCRNPRAEGFGTSQPISQRTTMCLQNLSQKTSAPTWLIGLDYKPIDDVMVYAKYARGYRQGGLALFSPDPIQPFEDEKVDSYEVGLKSNWGGSVPGGFDIFGYYNDFVNQQLLLSISDSKGIALPTVAIVNAGASRMYGLETELRLRPTRGLAFTASYAYVNSKLKEFIAPALPASSPWDTVIAPALGGQIIGVIPHQLTLSASYTLPLPPSVGDVSLGLLYTYSSAFQSANDNLAGSGDGRIPSAETLNFNFTWKDVASYPVDLKVFVTNVTNEVNYTFSNPQTTVGFVSRHIAPPRRFGVSMRYNFGG